MSDLSIRTIGIVMDAARLALSLHEQIAEDLLKDWYKEVNPILPEHMQEAMQDIVQRQDDNK